MYVPPSEPQRDRGLMLIGEMPGWEEQVAPVPMPFVGKAGQELWAGFAREQLPPRQAWYIRNVINDGLPQNKKPKPDEIAAALPDLLDDIKMRRPKLIVTAGATATNIFLPRKIADLHGLPHEIELMGFKTVILPIYHPAAGLHTKGYLPAFGYDLKAISAFLRGDLPLWQPSPFRPQIGTILAPKRPYLIGSYGGHLALDTEGWIDSPWGLSYSQDGKTGYVIPAKETDALRFLNRQIHERKLTVLLHNALHDLPILEALGVKDFPFHDTQVLAYHRMMRTGSGVLEAESQNLGTLAYRECGMELGELTDCPGVDLDRQIIPFSKEVIQYAGEDPCATYRLFQAYKDETKQEAYQIDLAQIPMLRRMQETGLPIDEEAARDYLVEITTKEQEAFDALEIMAQRRGVKDFNPKSHPQVRKMVTERLHLNIRKRTKGGKASTNSKALATHQEVPFVACLQKQRELSKLKGTYLLPLLEELQ